MSDEIAKYGLYYDDLYALRVLEPEVAAETLELVDECGGYAESECGVKNAIPCVLVSDCIWIHFFWPELDEFQRIASKFIAITDALSKQVDRQKMRTIGVQTQLQSTAKQRRVEQQELQNRIMERTLELERLKVELQYLQRVEAEQLETLDGLLQQT